MSNLEQKTQCVVCGESVFQTDDWTVDETGQLRHNPCFGTPDH